MMTKKVAFNVGGRPNLTNSLVEVFDSQIDGAKRYDLAAMGRPFSECNICNSTCS